MDSPKQQISISILYQQLICPITNEIMVDPVSIQTGHTFERKSIDTWFRRGNKTNPLTGQVLNSFNLIPNRVAKNIIQKLPSLKNQMRRSREQLENLLLELENMWNKWTSDGIDKIHNQNEQLKQELKQKCEQKLIQKLQMEAELQQKVEKIQNIERTNKYIRNLLNVETELKRIKQQENRKLVKQLDRLKSQKSQEKKRSFSPLFVNHNKSLQKIVKKRQQVLNQQSNNYSSDRNKRYVLPIGLPPKPKSPKQLNSDSKRRQVQMNKSKDQILIQEQLNHAVIESPLVKKNEKMSTQVLAVFMPPIKRKQKQRSKQRQKKPNIAINRSKPNRQSLLPKKK